FDSMERGVVHGSTFGGGDLAAAAGLAALQVLADEQLIERAARMGDRPIELGPPAGGAGRRLWEAIERRQPGLFAQLVTVPLFRDHHILTQVAGHHMNVVKALPPLVIEEDELRRFASALEQVLADAEEHLFRSYASLGFTLGRRTLTARRA